jgi:hypothetical protein
MPNITVTLTPAEAIANGAKWCIEGLTAWTASAGVYAASAGTYIVQYKPVEGYQTPADATVVVAANPVSVTGTYSGDAWGAGWNPPISICLFRGQVIAAGVKHTAPESTVADARLVRWSEIGAFRFLGATATTMRNEAGEYYIGESNLDIALRVLPIKTGIVVYGAYSITVLDPVAQPVPAFGISKHLSIGIANPLAVAGNDKKHLLIDTTGNLWLIALDARDVISEKSIGYSHIFASLMILV